LYRYQFHLQVQMGHFAEFQTLLEGPNSALQAKGHVPFELWEAALGRFNEFLMVAEYETLEVYGREHFAMHTDQACMDLWREMDGHLDGIPWTDLWSRPPGATCVGRQRVASRGGHPSSRLGTLRHPSARPR